VGLLGGRSGKEDKDEGAINRAKGQQKKGDVKDLLS
jgi:hypothetical protein